MNKEKIDWRQISQWHPVQADGVDWNNNGNTVIITMPRKDWRGRLLKWLISHPANRKLELDEIGSFVWEMCDGNHSVVDIITALMQRYQLLRQEAISSLREFFFQLHREGLISWKEMGKQ